MTEAPQPASRASAEISAGVRPRVIVHADLDAFFASVEQRDAPELAGQPVAVGGPPESRGVVAAASYEARPYGVRSAMSMAAAVRLCPPLVRVPPRFDVYRSVSEQVMARFRALTPLVEPISFDEAFLDLSAVVESWEEALQTVHELREGVRRELGLTLSAGVGSSKSVAKVASDLGKPDGFMAVREGRQREFLESLPAGRLWGVGPRTERRLADAGLTTAGDVAGAPLALLESLLGSPAAALRRAAAGEDDSPVSPEHERKSVGQERTFAQNISARAELVEVLRNQAAEISNRLQRNRVRGRTLTLKLRSASFITRTRSITLPSVTDDRDQIAVLAARLLEDNWCDGVAYRLIGISLSGFADDSQLSLPLPTAAA